MPPQYCEDMIHAGYEIGNRELVQDMARHTVEGYELLRRWGVTFAHNADGSIKLRHVSGHTYPRSLCQTTELIGEEIMKVMLPKLEAASVKIYRNCQVVDLLTEQGAVAGMTVREQGKLRQVYVGEYLGREQYGTRPLFYGPAFSSKVALDVKDGYCTDEADGFPD